MLFPQSIGEIVDAHNKIEGEIQELTASLRSFRPASGKIMNNEPFIEEAKKDNRLSVQIMIKEIESRRQQLKKLRETVVTMYVGYEA